MEVISFTKLNFYDKRENIIYDETKIDKKGFYTWQFHGRLEDKSGNYIHISDFQSGCGPIVIYRYNAAKPPIVKNFVEFIINSIENKDYKIFREGRTPNCIIFHQGVSKSPSILKTQWITTFKKLGFEVKEMLNIRHSLDKPWDNQLFFYKDLTEIFHPNTIINH